MKAIEYNLSYIEGYYQLISSMNISDKMLLIKKLNDSINNEGIKNSNSFFSSFGAWESKESADEIIASIRKSRVFNRKLEIL